MTATNTIDGNILRKEIIKLTKQIDRAQENVKKIRTRMSHTGYQCVTDKIRIADEGKIETLLHSIDEASRVITIYQLVMNTSNQ